MPDRNDIEYFRHRIDEERRRATDAHEGATRRIHLDLATRYAQRVEEAERRQSMR